MSWTCKGITKDGNSDRQHPAYEVHGRFCPQCGLSREEVEIQKSSLVSRILPLILAGVAAFALAGGGGFFVWQRFRSWQGASHRDERYGIRVAYPDAWELREPGQNYPPSALTGTKDLFQILMPDREDDSYRENILVKIEQVDDPPFLDEYADSQIARINQIGTFRVESDRTIQLGESSAREIVYAGDDGEYDLKKKRIIVEPKTPDDYFFLITYTADRGDYEEHLPEVEKAFESIELLK